MSSSWRAGTSGGTTAWSHGAPTSAPAQRRGLVSLLGHTPLGLSGRTAASRGASTPARRLPLSQRRHGGHGVRASESNGKAMSGSPSAGLSIDSGSSSGSVSLDVAGACVEPVFRSAPRPKVEADEARTGVRVLFLSEGNVCRSVIAEAVFRAQVLAQGLGDAITCESKAVRDYNVGEAPEPMAVQVAAQCGVAVDQSCRARLFRPAEDIVEYDLLVVFDKFNAADVLKEVSVFDTIDPTARFSARVRRMGDFCKAREVGDIDDPLYGNMGGADDLENLSDVVTDIQESCQGLLEDLLSVKQGGAGQENLRKAVVAWLKDMADMDWLVPPMLQKRTGNLN